MRQALGRLLRGCRYPQIVFSQAIAERIRRRFGTCAASCIVDIPCGDGEVTCRLSRVFDGRVTGVDLSPECISRAQQVARDADVEFEVADICDYLEKKRGIGVLCIVNSLFCLPNAAKAMKLSLSAIAPGGIVLVVIPNIHSANYLAFDKQNPCFNKLVLDEVGARELFKEIGFRVVTMGGVARARWYGRAGLGWMRSFRHLYLLGEDHLMTVLGWGVPSYFVFELAKADGHSEATRI